MQYRSSNLRKTLFVVGFLVALWGMVGIRIGVAHSHETLTSRSERIVFTARNEGTQKLYAIDGAVGEPGWSNPYAYANGNPTNLVDPSGMIAETPGRWDQCAQQSTGNSCAQNCLPILSAGIGAQAAYQFCVDQCQLQKALPSPDQINTIFGAGVLIVLGFNCSVSSDRSACNYTSAYRETGQGTLTANGIWTHDHYLEGDQQGNVRAVAANAQQAMN